MLETQIEHADVGLDRSVEHQGWIISLRVGAEVDTFGGVVESEMLAVAAGEKVQGEQKGASGFHGDLLEIGVYALSPHLSRGL